MSYEKDKLDSFVTSASLSTALAPYVTSNSLSAAIAGLNLAPYMTSNSISAAVATNTLTVRGTASVSATLSAGAVTVAGRPVGHVLLGYSSGTNVRSFAFSGSWSDFVSIELRSYLGTCSGTIKTSIYTDGGTTPILTCDYTAAAAANAGSHNVYLLGVGGESVKLIRQEFIIVTGGALGGNSATANSGVINCFRVSITGTSSYAFAALYGLRKT